ncbi:MAG: patatin-like phospholipase family protein [Gammaproteobacteria bacterium]
MNSYSNISGSDIKLGLALSGGGFRASFFHVGVLAKLAMLGLLRPIEVISTVSGGSVIGALYYLHVKKLLESKADDAINDGDYKELVENVERDFFEAAKSNFRVRTFIDLNKNLQTRNADYSHTDRIAELFDEDLYRPVLQSSSAILMRELKIQPLSAKPDFFPRTDNAGRQAKVPILVINATTLNTGRNWQFTAAWMGEPPHEDSVSLDIDTKTKRLRRPNSYFDLPHQKDLLLGHAVASSVAVPGIFHPLAISDTYPAIRVQLVDGGVHDNQGVQALIDEVCTHFIISDASGQLQEEDDPDTELTAVPERTDDIFQERLRQEQLFRTLETKAESRVALTHLRKGLPTTAVAWLDASGKPAEPDKVLRSVSPPNSSQDFTVTEPVQDLLSKIRTDLDSFTEVEAHSLMLDAYRMTAAVIPTVPQIASLGTTPIPEDQARWQFVDVAPYMQQPTDYYLQQLEAASEKFLKVFRLIRPKWLGEALRIALLLVPVVLLLYLAWLLRNCELSLGTLLFIAIIGAVVYFSRSLIERFYWLARLRSYRQILVRLLGRALFSVLISPLLWLHLRFINPLFLKLGAIERLKRV